MKENKIYNCNSYEKIKEIEDFSNIIIVTDPPYNIGYQYNSYKDSVADDEFYTKLADMIRDKKAVILMYDEMLHKLSIKLGYAPEKVISWVYNSHTPKEHRGIAFYNIKPDLSKIKQPYKNLTDKRIIQKILDGSEGTNIYDWWHIEQVKNVCVDKYDHPCQIPYEVMENVIKILPKEFTILDTFTGTGTTLLAAKNNDRNFIGFELDKKYCDIANDRLNGISPNGQTSIFTNFEDEK